MFSKSALVFLFIAISVILAAETNKAYYKEYYQSGTLKSKGWKDQGQKTGYWFFYHKNGLLEKEGHFLKGKMTNWWIFYNSNGLINHKCQLNNGKKNGYCLKYHQEKLSSAVKYSNGNKVKEWFDVNSFKKENKLSDLK